MTSGLGPARIAELIGAGRRGVASVTGWRSEASPDPGLGLWSAVLVTPGSAIPFLLYRPLSPGPWPAAVAIHQHNDEYQLGKSEPAGLLGDSHAAYGLALARRGFIVAMPDLDGFEDRLPSTDSGLRYEMFQAMNALVEGGTLHGRHVRDVLSVVDYLEKFEDVTGSVAVAGHSLGGQIALLSLAVDQRLKHAAISCGVTTYSAARENGILHNPGWYVPGLEDAGGYAAVAASLRDKRLLVLAAEGDEHFPAAGAAEVIASFPDGVATVRWRPGAHAPDSFTPEAIAQWLARE